MPIEATKAAEDVAPCAPASNGTDGDAIAEYVARFNDEEIGAGYLPSNTLGRFFAVLELRDVLRRSRTRRTERLPLLSEVGSNSAGHSSRKLKRSVVERLFRQGHLRREHLSAANDIERLFESVNRSFFASVRRYHRVQESRSVPDLFDRLSDVDQRRLKNVYWPWQTWLAREPLGVRFLDSSTTRYANPLPLIVDIVVDNCGMREAERRYRLRNGAARVILRGALHRYCLLAGYLHLPECVVTQRTNGPRRLG